MAALGADAGSLLWQLAGRGLSAGLVPTVTGRAQAVGGALGWGRTSFNKAYTQSGSAPLPRGCRRCTAVLTPENLVPDCVYTPYLFCGLMEIEEEGLCVDSYCCKQSLHATGVFLAGNL